MKKVLFALSGIAVALMSTGIASADTGTQNTPTSETTYVWVAKDITKSSHYQIERKIYDASGKVIGTKTITPPDGSMAEFNRIPLSQAQTEHLAYVEDTSDQNLLAQKLNQLHKQLFQSLHANKSSTTNTVPDNTISPMADPIPVGTYAMDSGTFNDNSGTAKYNIYYSKPNSAQIEVHEHDLWQNTGQTNSNYEWCLKWGNYQYNFPSNTFVPYGPSNATKTYWDVTNSVGQDFQTWLVGNNWTGTRYEGYDTLN